MKNSATLILANASSIDVRVIEEKDALAYYQLIATNRDRLLRYFPKTTQAAQTEQDALALLQAKRQQWKDKTLYPFGIFAGNDLIGWISAKNIDWQVPKCELGYYLDESAAGLGIATRAVGWLLVFCFEELQMNKVFLRIGRDNPASIRVAEKNGFVHEGTLRREYVTGYGELIDIEYYGLIK